MPVCSHLYEVKFVELESRRVTIMSWGVNKGELLFNGESILVLKDERVLEMAWNRGILLNTTDYDFKSVTVAVLHVPLLKTTILKSFLI